MKMVDQRYEAVVDFVDKYNFNDRIQDIGKGIYLSYPDFFNSLITSTNVNLPQISVNGTEYRDIRKIKIEFIYTIGVKSKVNSALLEEDKMRILQAQ
jgi:hypothetical protein